MKTPLAAIALLGTVAFALVPVACSSSAAAPPADGGAPPPTWTLVFGQVITQCNDHHSGSPPAGNLDMGTQSNAYANLVRVPASGEACGAAALDGGTPALRVKPGDAEASLLYTKLIGTATCGTQMPQQNAKLPQEQIDLVRSWINAGAPND